ncbi:MAG: hypothetical protein ACAH11_07115 [Sphingomonas sp.]
MRIKLLGIAGGLMLAFAPAAASAAEIDCISERTPAPVTAEVEKIAAQIVTDSDGTPGGERMIAEKLDGALKACTAQYRWSDAKAKSAMDYAIVALFRSVLRRNLSAANISLPAVDKVVAANPAVFNAPAGAKPSDAQYDKFIADARAAGLPLEDEKLLDMLLTYFGSVTVAHKVQLEFEGA